MKHFMESIRNNLLFYGLSREELEKIHGEIEKSNRQSLKAFSLITLFFIMVMFCLSFLNQSVEQYRFWYFFFLIMMAAVAYFIWNLEVEGIWLLGCIYFFIGSLFAFSMVLGTVADPDTNSVTFLAFLLTVPLLFTDRPLRMAGTIYLWAAVFSIFVLFVKNHDVAMIDMIHSFVFGNVSVVVSTYMMGVKCKRYLFEHKLAILSEYDVLTELHNRNSYEKNVDHYPPLCKEKLSCVYVDVNGLHELNNEKGHAAGDEMLRFVAAQLQRQFGGRDAYRIGGDEFVIFLTDCDPVFLNGKIAELITSVEQESYYISVGCATMPVSELNMKILVESAEQNMYDEKQRFYEKKAEAKERKSGYPVRVRTWENGGKNSVRQN